MEGSHPIYLIIRLAPARGSASETAIRGVRQRRRVSGYYILTGETVVEGPFETHREASQRRADLLTSDVGVTYRIEKR